MHTGVGGQDEERDVANADERLEMRLGGGARLMKIYWLQFSSRRCIIIIIWKSRVKIDGNL